MLYGVIVSRIKTEKDFGIRINRGLESVTGDTVGTSFYSFPTYPLFRFTGRFRKLDGLFIIRRSQMTTVVREMGDSGNCVDHRVLFTYSFGSRECSRNITCLL